MVQWILSVTRVHAYQPKHFKEITASAVYNPNQNLIFLSNLLESISSITKVREYCIKYIITYLYLYALLPSFSLSKRRTVTSESGTTPAKATAKRAAKTIATFILKRFCGFCSTSYYENARNDLIILATFYTFLYKMIPSRVPYVESSRFLLHFL